MNKQVCRLIEEIKVLEAKLKQAEACVEEARDSLESGMGTSELSAALDNFDDARSKPSTGTPFDEPTNGVFGVTGGIEIKTIPIRPHCPKCKDGVMVPDGDETYCDLMCGHRTEPDHFDHDIRLRYASGEVPMVGDVFEYDGAGEVTVRSIGISCVFDVKGFDWDIDDGCYLIRRAAPEHTTLWEDVARKSLADLGTCGDTLFRAVELLRRHQLGNEDIIAFIADFDKGGV